jgi:hypothetical protein
MYIVTSQIFDIFIILAILGNCIALGFDSNQLEFNQAKGEYYTKEVKMPIGVE